MSTVRSIVRAEPSSNGERIVIVGGGMAGLATAMALKNSGIEVLILERDPEPVPMPPTSAFEGWKRPGVPQLHHTHIFLARLRTILRDRHPELLHELERAGIVKSALDQVLPSGHVERPREPRDDDLLHLWGRRATFEYLLRRHVGALPHVRFSHSTHVEGLVVDETDGRLVVRGVEVKRHGQSEVIDADVVVDASGVRSKSAEWLRARGAVIDVDRRPSNCAYYCRHFRQHDPSSEPPRRGTGANIDYLIFGTFFAENGTFSIAFACPEVETELAQALKRADGFDHVCRQIPALDRWTSRSEPISRVLGGGGLSNTWNSYRTLKGPALLGFFPVGDSHVVTNPIYGRGCSMAFVQAHVLAQSLEHSPDPEERARHFHKEARRLLKPHFDFSVAADKAFAGRVRAVRGEPTTFFDKVAGVLYDEAFTPAIEEDFFVAREWLKVQQMSEISPPWIGLAVLVRTFFLWVVRKVLRRGKPIATFGPPRDEMIRCLPAPEPTELRQ